MSCDNVESRINEFVKTEVAHIHVDIDEDATDPFIGTGHSNDPSESSSAVTMATEVSTSAEDTHRPLLIAPPAPVKKKKRNPPGICAICNSEFPNKKLYEDHLTTAHTEELPYPCDHCSKRFALPIHLKTHQSIHNPNRFKGPPKFFCHLCNKGYHLKVSLKSHIKRFHLGLKIRQKTTKEPIKQHHSTKGIKNPNPYRKPVEIHQCPFCERIFNFRAHLHDHIIYHIKERPYVCSICQQTFALRKVFLGHVRQVHQNPDPHHRPKWQACQPSQCSICGVVLRNPSTLKRHMRKHTGEKPYECDKCGLRFRISCGLRKHLITHKPKDTSGMYLFKCLVCGKDRFKRFNEMQNHRLKGHKNILWKGEQEKGFGCGICGKPFYQRIQAVICAVLGHDPTHLQERMFRKKCPECPEERLGYHNLEYLRRHWKVEHSEKILPAELRIGMYCENLKVDSFPYVIIDKVKAQQIRENGPPQDLKSEVPLVVDLPLLPIPDEERFRKRKGIPRKKVGKVVEPEVIQCEICERNFKKKSNLNRHLKVVHDPAKVAVVKLKKYECGLCGRKYELFTSLCQHKRKHHPGVGSGEMRGRPRKKVEKIPDELPTKKTVGNKVSMSTIKNVSSSVSSSVLEIGDLIIKEEPPDIFSEEDYQFSRVASQLKFQSMLPEQSFIIMGNNEVDKMQNKIKSVNVKDSAAVKALLGKKDARVSLTRLNL